MAEQNQTFETIDDIKGEADEVTRWHVELDAATRELEKFTRQSERVVKQYRDDRQDSGGNGPDDSESIKTNIFWSNCQVLQSSLYSRPPKVDVSRRFKDFNDDVARVGGSILERLLNTDLETDDSDFDVSIRQAIQDWIIVGMGQLWYRYEVETETYEVPAAIDPMTGMEMGEPTVEERILDEDAISDYVFWKDFLWSPARIWQEVRWVARRVYMSRDQMVKRFGAVGKLVPLHQPKRRAGAQTGIAKNDTWSRAEVWELWDKESREVYWVVQGFDKFLDRKPDPLKLENFFPCPKPALANVTTTSTVPRADYIMAQDQYTQLNTLATRINFLVRACKVVGVYDKQSEGVQRMLQQGIENQLIPVDRWAAFAEKGGLKGSIDWLPVQAVAEVINNLRADYAAQKQELYEVLGIADIMRGASVPDETATAQSIKAQFGTSRIQFKQYELGAFVRDSQRIKAEIICRHFQPETIVKRSNIMNTPDVEFVKDAVALLKNPDSEAYRLHIESDSMAAMDWAAERDSKGQFLTAVSGFLQTMSPLAQAMPQSVPYLLKMLQFGMTGYRVGSGIESVLDQMITAASAPQQPAQPSPEQMAKVEEAKATVAQKNSDAELKKAQAQKVMAEIQAMTPKVMSEAQHKGAQANAENAYATAEKMRAGILMSEHLLPDHKELQGDPPYPDETPMHENAESRGFERRESMTPGETE